jgi:hypothetical protein
MPVTQPPRPSFKGTLPVMSLARGRVPVVPAAVPTLPQALVVRCWASPVWGLPWAPTTLSLRLGPAHAAPLNCEPWQQQGEAQAGHRRRRGNMLVALAAPSVPKSAPPPVAALVIMMEVPGWSGWART